MHVEGFYLTGLGKGNPAQRLAQARGYAQLHKGLWIHKNKNAFIFQQGKKWRSFYYDGKAWVEMSETFKTLIDAVGGYGE